MLLSFGFGSGFLAGVWPLLKGNMAFNFLRRSSHLEHFGMLTFCVNLSIMSPRPSIFLLLSSISFIPIYNENMPDYDYNEFDIDISSISDSDKICWKYTKDPPEDEDDWIEATDDLFCKLSPITGALATSSDFVHLKHIKPSNIMEWYYRLDSLFDAGMHFLFTVVEEGEIPIRITLYDLHDHLGLRVDTFHWNTQKFDRVVRNIRMKNLLNELL